MIPAGECRLVPFIRQNQTQNWSLSGIFNNYNNVRRVLSQSAWVLYYYCALLGGIPVNGLYREGVDNKTESDLVNGITNIVNDVHACWVQYTT